MTDKKTSRTMIGHTTWYPVLGLYPKTPFTACDVAGPRARRPCYSATCSKRTRFSLQL